VAEPNEWRPERREPGRRYGQHLAVKDRLRARKAACFNTAWTPQLPSTTLRDANPPPRNQRDRFVFAQAFGIHEKSANFAKRVFIARSSDDFGVRPPLCPCAEFGRDNSDG